MDALDSLDKAYELLYDIDVQDKELLEQLCDDLVFLGRYPDIRSNLELMSNRIQVINMHLIDYQNRHPGECQTMY